jgi:hypothetical protein
LGDNNATACLAPPGNSTAGGAAPAPGNSTAGGNATAGGGAPAGGGGQGAEPPAGGGGSWASNGPAPNATADEPLAAPGNATAGNTTAARSGGVPAADDPCAFLAALNATAANGSSEALRRQRAGLQLPTIEQQLDAAIKQVRRVSLSLVSAICSTRSEACQPQPSAQAHAARQLLALTLPPTPLCNAQAGPAAQEFFGNSPLGQALLARAKASPVTASLDGAGRAAADLASAAAEKLAGPLKDLAGAVSDLGAAAAGGAAKLGLKGLAAASTAVAPLAQQRLATRRAVAEPLAAAGERLAARSFGALQAQVASLPDPQEQQAAEQVLRQARAAQQTQQAVVAEARRPAGGGLAAGGGGGGGAQGPAVGSPQLPRVGGGKAASQGV